MAETAWGVNRLASTATRADAPRHAALVRETHWLTTVCFLALLVSALLAVAFFAERALRRDYERTAYSELTAVAGIAQARASALPALPPSRPEGLAKLKAWVTEISASEARVTIIGNDGQVFADSQSDSQTMENHAGRPEIREALAKGSGRAIRHSVTLNRDLLYYAVRYDVPGGVPVVLRFALPIETVDEVLQTMAVAD